MGAPDHLAVYLTNGCNMSCSYCYVAVNQGPPARLGREEVRRNIDRFLAEAPGGGRKVTFLGGEPFLDWELLRQSVLHARRAGGPDLVLQTFTNGTLVTPAKLAFLREQGVHVTISLDGKAEDNDRNRTFYKVKDRSAFEAVLGRLEGEDLGELGVSLTFGSETAGRLLPNVDFFARLGFGRIAFSPDLYERWSRTSLEVLRRSMDGLRRYYLLRLDGPRPPVLQALWAVLEGGKEDPGWWHDCHNMVVGPDDRYYACDKALSFPVGAVPEQRVGDSAGGLDREARARHYGRAARWLEDRGYGRDAVYCPMGVFFHSEIKGEDPEPAVANFHEVSRAFSDGLKAIARDIEGHPAFQRLYADARVV